MLIIRDDQLRALDTIMEARFRDRLVTLLESQVDHAYVPASRAERRDLVDRAIAEARRHGFATERELATFVLLWARHGPDCHLRPDLPFRDVLRAAHLAAHVRAAQLEFESERLGATGSMGSRSTPPTAP